MKLRRRRAQATVEVVILVAAVLIGTVAMVVAIPAAFSNRFDETRDVIASPM